MTGGWGFGILYLYAKLKLRMDTSESMLLAFVTTPTADL